MITLLAVNLIIFLVCFFGLLFAAYNAWWVSRIHLHTVKLDNKKQDIEGTNQQKQALLGDEEDNDEEEEVQKESVDLIKEIGEHISIVISYFFYILCVLYGFLWIFLFCGINIKICE